MNNTLTIRGLPYSLAMDGWWLDGGGASVDRPEPGTADATPLHRFSGLLFLVGLADVLFWRQTPGLSVALFGLAIFTAGVWRVCPRRALLGPSLIVFLGALPVVELLQPLSFCILVTSLISALVWAHHPQTSAAGIAVTAAEFVVSLPLRWIVQLDLRRYGLTLALGQGRPQAASQRQLLQNWAFPIGGCLIFTALLLEANPVFARLLEVELDLWFTLERGMFWVGVAILAAPFLTPPPFTERRPLALTLRVAWLGINAGSVVRALAMFNLLIGLQSLTDLSILVAGADLPAGMTFAEYAHRGAYPLLATAILAGGFALLAKPFLDERRSIRPLMLVWLAQNAVLCSAAALRLELYVETFGLTYLRVYALIWMGLVAAGLGLLFWQVLCKRDTRWLLGRIVVLAGATLYVCGFVNFAQLIAAQNVTSPDPDRQYLCSLGPLALKPIVESGVGYTSREGWISLGHCAVKRPQAPGWRDWGFREWSVSRYLDRIATGDGPHDHPDRG